MYRDKISRKHNFASIVELFLMFLLLLVVIVVITLFSMTVREQSLQAGDLTEAVLCAENTAEVTKYAGSAEEAAERMAKMEGISDIDVSGDVITAVQGDYRIQVTLSPEKGSSGTYVGEQIGIYLGDSQSDPVYELDTGSYRKEGGR